MTKKQVAKTNGDTELSASLMKDMTQYAGAGTEQATKEDYAIPLLKVLQALSPQCDPAKPDTNIPGARPGMFYNSVTKDVYESGNLLAMPVYFTKTIIEWKTMKNGGGFVNSYPYEANMHLLSEAKRDEKTGAMLLENGNQVVDTRQHYAIIVDTSTGETFPTVISLTATQVKKSRAWLSMIDLQRMVVNGNRIKPASWAIQYKLGSIPESNNEGSWFGWIITKERTIDSQEIWDDAVALHNSVRAGNAYAADPTVPE